MGKLRLNLDQLTVDSFDTVTPVREKGTVFGEQCSCETVCSCPGCPTCVNTECNQDTCHTCGWSCGGSCYYMECTGDTIDDPTCDPSRMMRLCCPY
jgi:hypothetical protein